MVRRATPSATIDIMDREEASFSLLPPHVQPVLAAGVAIGLVAMAGWLAVIAGRPAGVVDHDTPPTIEPRFTVNVNAAGADELATLPGLGATTAARIVEHRRLHGPFESLDDLLDVDGIGPATLDRLRPHLRPLRKAAPPPPVEPVP